jgi:DMSO/TMAO reductase YedYZ molybdopterin-dependent catalytic subunit
MKLGSDGSRMSPERSDAAWPTYRLSVEGRVDSPYELDYGDLSAMPATSVSASFLCGSGERWDGRWRGPALTTLLDRADPSPETTHLLVEGAGGYVACVPVATAYDGVVALERAEGGPLGREFPTRLVVPGVEAARTVKDVRRVAATTLAPDESPETVERGVDESPRAEGEPTVRRGRRR